MKKNKILNPLTQIILFSFLIKVFASLYISDPRLINEWSYLLHNYNISNTLGFNVVTGEFNTLPLYAKAGDTVLPSVFMPPLYFYFILTLQTISGEIGSSLISGSLVAQNTENLTKIIIFSQIILSSISIYFFYNILINFKNKKIKLFGCAIFAFFPVNIYASTQISSITLQLFLIILFLYFMVKIFSKKNIQNLLFFSFISALLILIRGEFVIFFFLTIVYIFVYYKLDVKPFLIVSLVTCIFISPHLIRNYMVFDQLILTKSFGYNLLKGNYKQFKVEGNPAVIDEEFKIKNLGIKSDKYFEINLDNFYKEKAFKYIKNDPILFTENYFKKVLSFSFVNLDSSYPGYYNFFHIVPKIFISILSLIGIFLLIKKKGFFQFITLYYVFSIFFFSIFFILPRYNLIILPFQIFLSLYSAQFLQRKFFN